MGCGPTQATAGVHAPSANQVQAPKAKGVPL